MISTGEASSLEFHANTTDECADALHTFFNEMVREPLTAETRLTALYMLQIVTRLRFLIESLDERVERLEGEVERLEVRLKETES